MKCIPGTKILKYEIFNIWLGNKPSLLSVIQLYKGQDETSHFCPSNFSLWRLSNKPPSWRYLNCPRLKPCQFFNLGILPFMIVGNKNPVFIKYPVSGHLGYFSHCFDKISDKAQVKGERMYFSFIVQDRVYYLQCWGRTLEKEAEVNIASSQK